jgi:transcriptional regulator with XRE-family HTH domain
MIRNEEIHKQALIFRKRGFTYQEIAKICGVHPSTIARWCSKKRFSKTAAKDNAKRAARGNAQRMQLLQKARQAERKRVYAAATETAQTEFMHHKNDPLFMSSLLLYRVCGDRSNDRVLRVTTQDWLAHREWQRFLGKYLGVSREKIRFYLVLYLNHNVSHTEAFWARKLKFPMKQFGKTQIIKQQVKRLHNGTGSTIIGNTVLKRKLNTWLDLLENSSKGS